MNEELSWEFEISKLHSFFFLFFIIIIICMFEVCLSCKVIMKAIKISETYHVSMKKSTVWVFCSLYTQKMDKRKRLNAAYRTTVIRRQRQLIDHFRGSNTVLKIEPTYMRHATGIILDSMHAVRLYGWRLAYL